MLEKLEDIGTSQILSEYECKVMYFKESHMILGIRIHHPDIAFSTRYLYFLSVLYFEGPMGWIGANFTISTQDATHSIWKRIFPDLPDRRFEQLDKRYYMCTMQNPNTVVNIAYGSLSVSEDAPFDPAPKT